MKKRVNTCLGCKDVGLPCMGKSCPNRMSYVEFCDECEEQATVYIDGRAYCMKCANELMDNSFADLSMRERAEILGLTIRRI